MLSHEVKKGDVHTVRIFGQDVVVFRGMDGTAAVLDVSEKNFSSELNIQPFCSHLGAHLGEGIHFLTCHLKKCRRCCSGQYNSLSFPWMAL